MSRTTRSRATTRSQSRGRRREEEEEEEEVIVKPVARNRSSSRARVTQATPSAKSKTTPKARSPSRSRARKPATETADSDDEKATARSGTTRSRSRATSRSRSTSRSRKVAEEETAAAKKEPKRRNDGFDPKTAAKEVKSASKSRAQSKSRDRSTPATPATPAATPKRSSSKKRAQAEEETEESVKEEAKKPRRRTQSAKRAEKEEQDDDDDDDDEVDEEDEREFVERVNELIDSDKVDASKIEEIIPALEDLSQKIQEAQAKSGGSRSRQSRNLEDRLNAIVAASSRAQHKLQVLKSEGADAGGNSDSEESSALSEKEPPVTLDSSFYCYVSLSFVLFLISQIIVLLSTSPYLRGAIESSLTKNKILVEAQKFISPRIIKNIINPSMSIVTLSIVTSVIQLIATFPLKYWAAEKYPSSAATRRFVRYVTSFIGSVLAIGIWLHFNTFRASESANATKAILVYLFAFYSHSLVAHADAATWPHVAQCVIQLFAASVCLFMNKSVPFADRSVCLVLFLRVCALAVQSIGSVGLFALSNRTAVSRGMTAVAYACSYLYVFVSIVTPITVFARGIVPPTSVKTGDFLAGLALLALNAISFLDDATPANSFVPFN